MTEQNAIGADWIPQSGAAGGDGANTHDLDEGFEVAAREYPYRITVPPKATSV